MAGFAAFVGLLSLFTVRKRKLWSKMSDSPKFSVVDGKLVREDEYSADFEENLTFEQEDDD